MIIENKFTVNTLYNSGDTLNAKKVVALNDLKNRIQMQGTDNLNYHNFSVDIPVNDGKSEYNVSITHEFNKITFDNYNEKVQDLHISDSRQIKNFYTLEENNIVEYYKSNLIPSLSDIWGNYTDYLFSNETIKKGNNPNLINKLPEFIRIKIPKINNLNKNKEETFYNINRFLSGMMYDKQNYFVYQYTFSNYFNAKFDTKSALKIKDYNEIFNLQNLISVNLPKTVYVSSNPITSQAVDSFVPDVRDTLDNIIGYSDLSTEQLLQEVMLNKRTTLIPLFYKITKKRQKQKFENADRTETLQNVYIPYVYDQDLEYIDNQVLPFQDYIYSITLVCLSVGYTVTKNAEIAYVNPTIIDINFFEGFAIEKDSYPVIPEPSIYPIFNQPNNIKIFLNTKTAYEKPIFFTAAETSLSINADEPVFFSKRNFKEYIVYKINEKPSSYSAFNYGEVIRVTSDKNAFYDILEENKMYYYTFRAYDGKRYSNPSVIYEVEIKNINGAIVPIIRSFNFDKVDPLSSDLLTQELPFKQRVSIKPSYYQTSLLETKGSEETYKDSEFLFDRSRFKNLESIFQGTGAPQYKIRLISKTSGKMIDINLDYRYQIKNKLKK